MNIKWNYSNIVTGDAATDNCYLRRDHIIEAFWREVKKGNHILFVAPRRVGKTSIMKDLAANCPDGYVGIYEDIEGVKSRDEFYKCLFELILHSAHGSRFAAARSFLDRCIKKYSIKEISKSGIRIESRDIDYEKEIRNLLPELKDARVHAVIFLDEFAEVIYKLKESGNQQDAVDILHTLRAIRSDEDFKHFTVVYGGSIGLEFVIKHIGRPKLINDLHPIKIAPLKPDEARQLIRQITEGATIRIPDEIIAYLREKLEYLLPYYIHLMIEAIDEIAFENNEPGVNSTFVDEAYQRVSDERKNFEDWYERLKTYHAEHFPFINQILRNAAHEGGISVTKIYNLAMEYGRTEDYMDFVDMLRYDGYLKETDGHIYRFTSPLLRGFWLRKYPLHHV